MKKYLFNVLILLLIISSNINSQQLTDYVNPFIGTGGHGHTYPGATLPYGMVQVSPDTRVGNWDACGGYHYTDKSIIGFSHQHLSGVGVLDYGDILFMPTSGKIYLAKGGIENSKSGYRSDFDHSSEVARPGYYSVFLKDYSIKAELTSTTRAGFHRYSYKNSESKNIIVDLTHQLDPSEKIINIEFKVIDDNKIQGMRRSAGWAADQIVYFYAEFSEPFSEYGISCNGKISNSVKSVSGNDIKAFLKFNQSNSTILAKVGISAVDYKGAKNNLLTEISHWNFDEIKNDANSIWNKQLSKIKITDKSLEKKKNFYTALYHSNIVPNKYFDVDRRYRGNDRKIHKCDDFDNYTVLSLWDTFRATHPLLVLLEPTRAENIIKSILEKYKQSGVLPKWELAGNETGTMIGYHSVSVIADAYIKGLNDFNTELALEAMLKSSNNDNAEMNLYKNLGYIPSDRKIESVSKTLEYSYDDWCIYTFANAIGQDKIAENYKSRAKFYLNLFDGNSGFFRGKKSNGNWDTPFNPFEISRNYTEANAWQYSMFVPHDVIGLINLHGNKNNLIQHLDKLFTSDSKLSGHDIPDITGLIGQYAHGNEPSHHVAYLYNFLNEPWKTQNRINQIINEMYTSQPDGLIGNEDCGQMSSWLNFSSLGFYPFCPGTDEYQIGSPQFDLVEVNLENGKKITIESKNLDENNFYIQSMKINNKINAKSFLTHKDLKNGAKIEFVLGNDPNKSWGTLKSNKPYSLTQNSTASIPYVKKNIGYYLDEVEVEFGCKTENVEIRFTLDNSEPTENSLLYAKPFKFNKTTIIKARAFKEGILPSEILIVSAEKAEYLNSIELENPVNGINYKYYEKKFSTVFDIEKEKVKKTGELNYINLGKAEKEDDYAFVFEGYLNIPENDVYTFYCKSDDGSVLLLHGKEVVNNDGSHAAISASNVIALKKGFHPFKLLYFEDYEGNSVELFWESSKIDKELVPENILYKK